MAPRKASGIKACPRATRARSRGVALGSGRAAAEGRGRLVGVQRADLVADAEILDRAVLRGEVELEIDLVGVEHAEAGRDDQLLVADALEALGDDVVAVDADRAAHGADEAGRDVGVRAARP